MSKQTIQLRPRAQAKSAYLQKKVKIHLCVKILQ